MKVDISVVLPIYNEEANINLLYNRVKQAVSKLQLAYELIFVNDGSRDQSIHLIKQLAQQDPTVKYINFSRNFGHQIAVTAGLNQASGNAVVIIDADLQDPPELIVDLYNKLKEGYEVVYAKRRRRSGENFMKLFTAKLFYRILSRITTISIPVDTGDFRIIDRKVVDVLKKMPEQHKFLRGQISWIGFRQTFVEYDRDVRAGGTTGYTYSKMLRFAIDGITSFSDFPLKMASLSGFVVSGIAFVLLVYALYARLVQKDYVEGWASVIVSVLFLGGIQLIAIGVIGEYIGRISQNIKNRPLYIVDETNIIADELQENIAKTHDLLHN